MKESIPPTIPAAACSSRTTARGNSPALMFSLEPSHPEEASKRPQRRKERKENNRLFFFALFASLRPIRDRQNSPMHKSLFHQLRIQLNRHARQRLGDRATLLRRLGL